MNQDEVVSSEEVISLFLMIVFCNIVMSIMAHFPP